MLMTLTGFHSFVCIQVYMCTGKDSMGVERM